MQRLLVGTTNLIDAYFAVGETLTDLDAVPSVVVTDSMGDPVTSGLGTDAAGTGHYSFQLPAQAEVNRLKVVWTGAISGNPQSATQYYEIVGAFLFSLADLRKMEGIVGESVIHTTEELVDCREQVTDLFNDYTDTSFGEAYWSEIQDGLNLDYLTTQKMPLRRVLSLKVNGVAVSSPVASAAGIVTTSSYMMRGTQNLILEYVYGHQFVPGDVKRAALRLARHYLLSSDSSLPDRARMMTTEWGSFQLTIASDEYPTGLPEVDAVLRRYRQTLPGFA